MADDLPAAKRTVLQDGRAKAYRPLPTTTRRAALADGLAAYARGDFFLAHEILEPAWMGTADLGERAVLQGLIKLSAAFVHAARGNPRGIAKNLRGARDRLATSDATAAGRELGIDVVELVDRVTARLVALDRETPEAASTAEPELLAVGIPRVGRG